MTAHAPAVESRAARIDELRGQLDAIDGRAGEVAARLAAIPGEDRATRLAAVEGDLTQRQAQKTLEALAAELSSLEPEAAHLTADREAVTSVLGDLEAQEAEARADEAFEAGAAVQARIVAGWARAGEGLAIIAKAWPEIVEAEQELAGLRDLQGDRHDRRAELASPSEPLPRDFEAFAQRLVDAALDQRQLGHGNPTYYGKAAAVLPDLGELRPRNVVWLPSVQPFAAVNH